MDPTSSSSIPSEYSTTPTPASPSPPPLTTHAASLLPKALFQQNPFPRSGSGSGSGSTTISMSGNASRRSVIWALLLSAHKALLEAADLLGLLPQVMGGEGPSHGGERAAEKNFVELGSHWKAPFYEITLGRRASNEVDQGSSRPRHDVRRAVVSLFNNLISNETNDDVEAEFQNSCYILPRRSSFHMSDLRQIRDLVPAQSSQGFNLIVIDPPWENGSVHQKAAYPTLPNRYFFNLPVKELAHEDGALVVLWMTNREKLRMFVEKELLPGWGVTDVTPFYWLKVKPDGSLICDLDLFHHRPYECFLIGYINVDVDFQCTEKFKYFKSSQVIISVPGAHSRKPPLESPFNPRQKDSGTMTAAPCTVVGVPFR